MNRLRLANLIDVFLKARPRLEVSAYSRTKYKATAEDLIQDAWLKMENTKMAGEISNPAGFINQVAKTNVSSYLRKERRRAEIDAEVSDLLWETSDELSPERCLIGRERLEAAYAILDALPEKTRDIFLMNRIEGISHRRIAEMLGITDEAVYYHIRRALERLADLRGDLAD